jgi:transcriptional regulator with XRE-family HTH domain
VVSTPREIGERIKAARRQRRMTQDELAVAVGVSRSAVAQWETGRAGQLTGNLSKIAAALDIGVAFLMHGDGTPRPAPAHPNASSAEELALLRLYRDCSPQDRQLLLRTARRLVGTR